jgi:hypothetical protein
MRDTQTSCESRSTEAQVTDANALMSLGYLCLVTARTVLEVA